MTKDPIRDLLTPLCGAIMIGCLALALLPLVGFFRSGHLPYLVALCALTAFGAQLSYRLYRGGLPLASALGAGTIELAALLVVRQLGADIIAGNSPIAGGLPRLDLAMLGLALPIVLAWLAGSGLAATLVALDEPPGATADSTSPAVYLNWYVTAGGAALVAAAAVWQAETLSPPHVVGLPLPGPMVDLGAYVLLGIALLAQSRYIALQARWAGRGIVVAEGFADGWIRSSLGLVVLAMALAFLPPLAAPLLSSPVHAVQAPLGSIVGATAVEPPVNTLLPAASGPTTAPPASPPHMAPREHVATLSPTWSLFLKGVLLWLIVLVSLIARLRSRRLHPGDRPGMWQTPVALLAALRRLMLAWRRRECRPHDVTHLPRRRLPVPRRAPRQPSGGQVEARHPREQVLAASRDILDRAARRGKPRCPSATPHEFSAALTADLPALQDDLERLTTAFVEARYSHHVIPSQRADAARASGYQVRRGLRRLRKRRAQ